MACLILIAIGILVINMSTGDLITSSATVGNKRAQLTVESGVTKVVNDVRPENWTSANGYSDNPYIDPITNVNYTCGADNYPSVRYQWVNVTTGEINSDPPITANDASWFAVCHPTQSSLPYIPQAGGELSGGGVNPYNPQAYIYRYDSTVIGRNTSYKSKAQVDIGVGFGPL